MGQNSSKRALHSHALGHQKYTNVKLEADADLGDNIAK